MKKPTPFEIAMIAATLGRPDAQGVSDALRIYKLAAVEIDKPETDTKVRTMDEAIQEIGLKSREGLRAVLVWGYLKEPDGEVKAKTLMETFKKKGVPSHFIPSLDQWNKAKKRETMRNNRLGKKKKRPDASK